MAGELEVTLTEPEMHSLAARLAPLLVADDAIFLRGDLGSGKTSFARALIRALSDDYDAELDIPSPTFTLVQTYDAPNFEVLHADLYRLSDSSEVLELGLFEASVPQVCLVEWPERLGDLGPKLALTLHFDGTGATRKLRFESPSAAWQSRISSIL